MPQIVCKNDTLACHLRIHHCNIDAMDIQLCANAVLGAETDPEIVALSDVNDNGSVNELDVEEIIDIILKK